MKTVYDQMAERNAQANIIWFKEMQGKPYDWKVKHAEEVARAYFQQAKEKGLHCHASVGGLDSITLHYFLEYIGVSVPCISCSSLENPGVRAVHRQIAAEMEETYAGWEHGQGALTQEEIDRIKDPAEKAIEQKILDEIQPRPRFYFLKPLKAKVDVIREFGWPVLSKEIAGKIGLLQNPSEKNATVRHAIITGETGEYGGNREGSRMQLSDIWLHKFGGADKEGAALGYRAAPFCVSDRCCYYLKERPADIWARDTTAFPISA